MRKLFLLIITLFSTSVIGAPPVDNTLPPCDDSINGAKPPCTVDADSIMVPPPIPNEGENIITPPEEPVRNTPDGTAPGGDIVDEPRPGTDDGMLR